MRQANNFQTEFKICGPNFGKIYTEKTDTEKGALT